MTAATSASTSSSAPTFRTSSPSATSSGCRCSPTRPPTRAGSPPRPPVGQPSYFDATVIPSVAYTHLAVAWAGLTETEPRAAGSAYGKGVFPWAASGRALSLGRDEGLTKLRFAESIGRLVGAGITGPNAGELIAEIAHAIEMGADAADIALTIHPHPTLSETTGLAAEAFAGTIIDLHLPKKR
jgi:dihydrolipoyl dehydrogenase